MAEHRAGAARGSSEAVVVTIGERHRLDLILRGELYRGAWEPAVSWGTW